MFSRNASLSTTLASVLLACGGNGTASALSGGSSTEARSSAGGASTGGGTASTLAVSSNSAGTTATTHPTSNGGTAGTTTSVAAGGTKSSKWVGGYYPGYQRTQYPPNEIDFSAITHLFVGAGLPQSNGSVDMTLYIDQTQGPALARDLVARTHTAGRKAILMLGGAGAVAGFRAAASDANRATFVQQLIKLVDDFAFDGLDLDWEPIETTDHTPLLKLAQALRAARSSLVLTIPVGYLNINYQTVDPFYVQLAAVVDQMNLMTYGMAGAWDGWQSWHSSALSGEGATTPTSVKSSIQKYITAGVPAAKLGIGIGFYGLCYGSPVTAPKQTISGSTATADDNELSYANIMTSYYTASSRKFDTAAGVPYLSSQTPVGALRCTYLSYEDEESIQLKGEYVREAGLGGAIIWTINEGHLSGAAAGQRDPLLAATKRAFLE